MVKSATGTTLAVLVLAYSNLIGPARGGIKAISRAAYCGRGQMDRGEGVSVRCKFGTLTWTSERTGSVVLHTLASLTRDKERAQLVHRRTFLQQQRLSCANETCFFVVFLLCSWTGVFHERGETLARCNRCL